MEKYPEGTNMSQFVSISVISVYNNNYYNGFGSDLLFAKSDDDVTTEWYIVKNKQFIYMGESYCTDHDMLHRFDKPNT